MATKRIAVLGGPRCGKTTLIQHLYVEMKIAGLNAGYALEYSTEYLKDKGMIETISEQYGIYLGQKKLEDELSVFDYALTDYATFVPYIYGRFMLGNKERTKNIPVIVITSIERAGLKEDFMKLNVQEFIKKEYFEQQSFIRTINKYLDISINAGMKN